MKPGENYEIGLFERQTTFTLEDVRIDTKIPINAIFIDKQENLVKAKYWLEINSGDIGFDIETRGLDPHQHEIIMVQFGDLNTQFVVDTRKVDISSIIGLLINPATTLVGQNLKFEYKFIKHNYNRNLLSIKDTMLQEICLYNGFELSNSLQSLAERYLGYKPDKTIRMRFLEIGDKPFSKDEIVYGAYDVILPLLISKEQEKILNARNQKLLLNLEHEYLKVLGDIEYKGMHFDKNAWKKLYEENEVKYKDSITVLNKFIINNNLSKFIKNQLDMFDNTSLVNIQWSSPKQVIELFVDLGICPKEISKTTKKLVHTVNAKVIKASLNTMNKDIKQEYKDLLNNYLEMKEYEQRVTTFGIDFFKYINPTTNRLHTDYFQIVSTGRSSSRNPNLQNIPSDTRYRNCFTAPEGFKIVNADFSGQENIVLANKSLDSKLLEFYKGGFSDMHSFIASKIFDTPMGDILESVRKKDNKEPLNDSDKLNLKNRGIAKAAGFAINYGGNGYTISKNLGITATAGDKVYDAYFRAFPGLKNYFNTVINKTLKDGFITVNNITNRRLNLIDYDKMIAYSKDPSKKVMFMKLKSAISRLSLNAPIQGTAADVTKNAGVRFRNWLLKEELHEEVWITNMIHDEINVECTTELAELVAMNLERCMKEAGNVWCKTIPLNANAAIGDYWAH